MTRLMMMRTAMKAIRQGMMDSVATYNQERWDRLVDAGALFTRPYLNLDESTARQRLDPHGILDAVPDDVAGKDVLCLASGGGQQSAAFAVLGAHVTVVDLSAQQLERDREVAAHYDVPIRTVQADMRDLSQLDDDCFDIVWHPYSINFVPTVQPVFAAVARVLRSGGFYQFMCANPFSCGMGTRDWKGAGYALRRIYRDGEPLEYADEDWVFRDNEAPTESIGGPREYRHALSTVLNSLAEHGFVLRGLQEEVSNNPEAEPATWDHFVAAAPPWFFIWATYLPTRMGEWLIGGSVYDRRINPSP